MHLAVPRDDVTEIVQPFAEQQATQLGQAKNGSIDMPQDLTLVGPAKTVGRCVYEAFRFNNVEPTLTKGYAYRCLHARRPVAPRQHPRSPRPPVSVAPGALHCGSGGLRVPFA